jgi:hypothetical protein
MLYFLFCLSYIYSLTLKSLRRVRCNLKKNPYILAVEFDGHKYSQNDCFIASFGLPPDIFFKLEGQSPLSALNISYDEVKNVTYDEPNIFI